MFKSAWPKSTWRGTSLFHPTGYSSSRKIRTGTWDKNWCRALWGVLLTGLLTVACSVCYLTALRTFSTEMVTSTTNVAPRGTSVTNQDLCFPTGRSGTAFSQISLLLPKLLYLLPSWHKTDRQTGRQIDRRTDNKLKSLASILLSKQLFWLFVSVCRSFFLFLFFVFL